MNNKTITVAIPSYNKEKYIKLCIESVLNDKDYIDQIIVVDNKSTDKTIEIARKYEPLIACYQNEVNIGMSRNFNKCIELCKTDYLMILHADDELVPGSIKKYINIINEYPEIGIIHADSYSMIENDKETLSRGNRKMKRFWIKGSEAMKCHYGVCSSVMVKMDAYRELGGFIESSLSSDFEMWARVASKYNLGSIDSPTVIYRINQTSTGPQSLINRSVLEIKEDWDNLHNKVAESMPNEVDRCAFIKKYTNERASNFLPILKANIKAKKIKNSLDAMLLIITSRNGFLILLKDVINIIKK